MKILPENYEMMVFLGQDPAWCKIIVDMYPMVYSGHVLYPKLEMFLWIYGTLNKMNEYAKNFIYFSCEMSYENEKYFNKYSQNFLKYWEF